MENVSRHSSRPNSLVTHYQILAHPNSRSRGTINIFYEAFSLIRSGETDESSSHIPSSLTAETRHVYQ